MGPDHVEHVSDSCRHFAMHMRAQHARCTTQKGNLYLSSDALPTEWLANFGSLHTTPAYDLGGGGSSVNVAAGWYQASLLNK